MSIRATNFARRLRGLDATEKAVAFVYADHTNQDTGETYPAMDTVADEAGLADRSTASKATGRLADYKIILTDKPSKGGKPTVWKFNYTLEGCPSTITLAPSNRVPKSQSTVTKDHSPKKPNCDPKQPNCDPKQPNCDPESHKGFEPKSKGEEEAREKKEGAAKPAAPGRDTSIPVPEWMPLPQWSQYLQFRKDIRKPANTYTQELAVKKLAALRADGHDPAAIIEDSILGGHPGLYAPRKKYLDPDKRTARNMAIIFGTRIP